MQVESMPAALAAFNENATHRVVDGMRLVAIVWYRSPGQYDYRIRREGVDRNEVVRTLRIRFPAPIR
jgi:uncharacterized membrane protein